MRAFGHVGDSDSTAHQVSPEKVPVFDQTHVDYLLKAFNIGAVNPVLVDSMDGAIAAAAWASIDKGQREVISHIQELIKKGRP